MDEQQVKAVIGDLFLQVVALNERVGALEKENEALRQALDCPQPESGDDRG